jgi:hypothetical protein
MAQDLILKEKCKDMMKYAYQALRDIPRDYRYTLGADIRASMNQLLRLIVQCGKRYHKRSTLEDLDVELDALRSLIHVAVENRVITVREFEHWSGLLNELGRMVGGWLRSVRAKH